MTKVCNTCGVEKPRDKFYKDARSLDEKSGHCKICHKLKLNKDPKYARPAKRVAPSGYKICSKCQKIKKLDNFYKQGSTVTSSCKTCYNDHAKSSRKDRLIAHNGRMAQIKHTYNMTENELQNMLYEQQGCCAICRVDFGRKLRSNKGRQYMIDHSHITNTVRGLLCMPCNMYVGAMEAQKSGPDIVLEYIDRGY